MRIFNKQKGMYALLVAVASMIGITIYGSCSADEDFWGFDANNTSEENTRSEVKDMSEYLTLSTYDFDLWTERDYVIIGKAIQRIGVVFSKTKNQYEFHAKGGKAINISDSLFRCVTNLFEHTNTILNMDETMKIIRKKANREGPILLDCVPAALSHMGRYAPTYAQAVADCDELCEGWRDSGVCGNCLHTLMDAYTECNYTFHRLYEAFTADSVGLLESLVMKFPVSNSSYHAVNAVAFNTFGEGFVYYNDYSSTSHGSGLLYMNHYNTILYMFND